MSSSGTQIPVGRSRWLPVAAFAALAGANQAVWLAFAPITSDTAAHYGVSENAVGWLANVFPLLYVLLALPAGLAIDRWFRPALAAGAILTAAGALIRLGGDGYAWAMAGAVAAGVAQPFVNNAIAKLATSTLNAAERPTGIAVGAAGMVVGQLLGLLLGPLLAGDGDLSTLLVVEAVGATVAAIGLLAALRRPLRDAAVTTVSVAELRTLWRDGVVRRLAGLMLAGFGVFIALTTWLQSLLEPAGVSDDTAGAMLVGMLLVGIVTTAVLPPLVARRRREARLLGVVVVAAVLGCLLLGLVRATAVDAIAVVTVGALLSCALPVAFELVERRTGDAAGSAVAILWLTGNVGGLLVAGIVGGLLDHRFAAFLVMALAAAAALPLLRGVRAAFA
ncbi:MFS transporter [Patulibacter defluvii]|uniref:MFS transporter n=1 Tax=Patulibacter defluvii TaxID=3095358 RepID=UPI002A75CB54|nr:MFS transporter [Patulibacter sp. DM4]